MAAGLLALLVILGLLAYGSGWLVGLRYASFPGHPYPPAGYYQNPFNAKDRGDLIHAAEAGRIKADLLNDGDAELRALSSGDMSALSEGDTGNRLEALRQTMAANSSQGIVERWDNRLTALLVGRLADPNDPAVTWCVEERGSSTVTYSSRATGASVRTTTFEFVNRFWLRQMGDRYLITDAELKSSPQNGS